MIVIVGLVTGFVVGFAERVHTWAGILNFKLSISPFFEMVGSIDLKPGIVRIADETNISLLNIFVLIKILKVEGLEAVNPTVPIDSSVRRTTITVALKRDRLGDTKVTNTLILFQKLYTNIMTA